MKRPAVSIVSAFLVCGAFAESAPVIKHKGKELGIAYPETLAEMQFDGVHVYKKPALGCSVRYKGRNLLKSDIYVYDGGIADIPNGCNNAVVKSEAASVGRALHLMQQRGDHTGLKHLKSGIVPRQGRIRFAWSMYEYAQAPGKRVKYTGLRVSESFVTGFSGRFVKIRLTYKKNDMQHGKRTADRLVKQMVGLMENAERTRITSKIAFVVGVDTALPKPLMAPWLGYLLGRQAYILKHVHEYDRSPGVVVPKFEEEAAGRDALAQIWKELKERDDSLKDKYLDKLLSVHKAGFTKEYVWTYLRQRSWTKKPEGLNLKQFAIWRRKYLKSHKAQSHGEIRVVEKPPEPETRPSAGECRRDANRTQARRVS